MALTLLVLGYRSHPVTIAVSVGVVVTQMQPLKVLESPASAGFFALTLLVVMWPLVRRAGLK